MHEELAFKAINDALIRTFPELKERCRAVGYPEENGAYIIFGDVFVPYIRETASRSAADRSRVGIFIGVVAELGDVHVQDLLDIEVLVTLLENQAMVDAYWPYLGASVRRKLRRMAVRTAPEIELPPVESTRE